MTLRYLPSTTHRRHCLSVWTRSVAVGSLALTLLPGARAATLVPPASSYTAGYIYAGHAVSLSGGNAVIASNANSVNQGGVVYLYHNVDTTTGTVSQSAQLAAADGFSGDAGENFGVSVAIQGGVGLVGADLNSNSGGNFTPSVYVFRGLTTATGTVNESAILRPSNASSTSVPFGDAVSLSGTTGLVGAYNNIINNVSLGSAYVYRNLDTVTGTVTENVRLQPSDGANQNYFGYAVSLSGTTGLVGAYQATVGSNTRQGAAYVFRNLDTASGTVTQNVKLVASDGAASNFFGFAVSESGNTALVGAYRATVGSNATQGAAYVFRNLDTATGTINQNVKLVASDGAASDDFGYALALSGNTALVGANQATVNGNRYAGAAYLFRNLDTASGTVTENVKLFATVGAANSYFGGAVAVDGDNFVIGAYGANSLAGQSYSGSLGSVSTLDLGNVSKIISGVSFISQDNWVIGQTTSGNQVTLSAGDSATVTASGKGVYIGQNAGSSNNRLVIAGTVNANSFVIGANGNTGNTLQLGNGGTTGSLPVGATISNSGVLAFNRSNAVVQGTDFNGAALTGTGGVSQLGTGTTTLNAANTYTGPTTVSAGTLQAGSTSAFGVNSAVTMGNVAGATLALNGFNVQIGSLTGGGAAGGNVTLGSASLNVGGDNTSPAAFAGSISGTGGLTKSGAGILTLTGSSSYSGATAVNAGTLVVNGALTGAGMVTVLGPATLAGTGTIAGAVMLPGGTFAPGQAGAGKLTLGGSLNLAGAMTAAFTLSGTGNTQAAVAGAVNLGSTSLTLNLTTGYTPAGGTKFYVLDETGTQVAVTGSFNNAPTTGSTFTQNGVTYQINYLDHDPADTSNALLNDVSVMVVTNAVPEPSIWAMMFAGAGLLGFMTLRRRTASGR